MQTDGTDQNATEWSQATKRTVAIAGVLIGIFVLYISRPVIPFIILAAIVAFLLNPIVVFFNTRLRMPRWWAVLLTYILLLVAVVLLPLILIPAVVDALRDIDIDLVDLLATTTAGLQRTLGEIRYIAVLNYQFDLSPVVDPALEMLTGVVPEAMIPSPEQIFSSIPSALELATGFASTVVGTVLWAILAFLFTLIFAMYLSYDWYRYGDAFLSWTPVAYRAEYVYLGRMIRRVWVAYFRGQLILSLTVGLVVGIGTTALGLPGGLLLGILAGLLEVLPNIGPVLASIPAILLAFLQGSAVLSVSNLVFALIVALFYFIVQQLENNIIVPRLIGQAVDLPPILVMAGVLVGASVGGILGAFMAAPIIATGRILAQYAYSKIVGRSPFSPEVEPDPGQVEVESTVAPEASIKSAEEDEQAETEHLSDADSSDRSGEAHEVESTPVSGL